MQRAIMFILILVISSIPALNAQTPRNVETAGDLIQACQTISPSFDSAKEKDPYVFKNQGYCLGFLRGILASVALAQAVDLKPLFCAPKDMSLAKALNVFQLYMDKVPGARSKDDAGMEVILSLTNAFPCQSPSK